MFSFIVRRFVSGSALIFVTATVTFFLTGLTGSDPGRRILGPTATIAEVKAMNAELGIDQPLVQRYLDWMGGALQGDLGTSWFTNQPITTLLSDALPVTLSIVVSAIAITAVLSIALGVFAAVRGGVVDQVVQVLSIVGFAIPNFLIGLLLAVVFAVQLGLFPAIGYIPFGDDPVGWITSLTLPALALAIGAVATVSTQTRGSMLEVLDRDYVRTLRSRGLPTRSVLFRHALRNAAPASLTVLSLQFIGMMSGAVVIEKVFGLNGVGQSATSAAGQGDVPLILGVVLLVVTLVVVVNLLADLLLGWLNPKVRIS